MEKRFVAAFALSVLILLGWSLISKSLFPPPPHRIAAAPRRLSDTERRRLRANAGARTETRRRCAEPARPSPRTRSSRSARNRAREIILTNRAAACCRGS
jgi:hypothetical protein